MAPKKNTEEDKLKRIEFALMNINQRITELNASFSEFMDVIIPLLEPPKPSEHADKLKKLQKKTKDDTGGMYR